MSVDKTPSSKGELLEALRSSGDEVLRMVRGLPAEHLEEGRYENGWNGRQILAHIASIEWSYPRLIDIARAPASPAADELPTRTMRGGNDAYNDRQVAKRAHLSAAELLAEFEKNRAIFWPIESFAAQRLMDATQSSAVPRLAVVPREAVAERDRVGQLVLADVGLVNHLRPRGGRSRESQAVVKGGTTSRRSHLTWSGYAPIEAVS